jgi:hypothetical protein
MNPTRGYLRRGAVAAVLVALAVGASAARAGAAPVAVPAANRPISTKDVACSKPVAKPTAAVAVAPKNSKTPAEKTPLVGSGLTKSSAVPATAAASKPAAASAASAASAPRRLVRCFVPNCASCNTFNPYLCATCDGSAGYALDPPTLACGLCLPNFEQNLEERTFTCVACPPGVSSPGGKGEASQCVTC